MEAVAALGGIDQDGGTPMRDQDNLTQGQPGHPASQADRRDVIRAYNRKILAHSSDQIMPVRRPFGGRWFDDVTVRSR